MNKLLSEEAITWITNTLLVMKSTIMKHNAEVAQSLFRSIQADEGEQIKICHVCITIYFFCSRMDIQPCSMDH